MAQINAAVAVILNESKSKVYISFRQKFQTYCDYWEFPGGKLEDKETFEECIKREVYEEIGVIAGPVKLYMEKKHINKDNIAVRLKFFIVEDFRGIPYARENQKLKLVNISDLKSYKFLPASIEVIDKLQNDYL